MKTRVVVDKVLGDIEFPAADVVMAPIIQAEGEWEPSEIAWLKATVKPGYSCVNVGANVGYFAMWMSRLVGPRGKVWAFEPNPQLVPILKRNLARAGAKNVIVIPKAAGSTKSTVDLYLNESNFGDSRVYDPRTTETTRDAIGWGFAADFPKAVVEMTTVDTVVAGERVDVALLDAQGWDFEVLRGMEQTIAEHHPAIITEFTPTWLEDMGIRPVTILKEYARRGYDLSCEEFNAGRPATPRRIARMLRRTGTFYVNILMTPLQDRQ